MQIPRASHSQRARVRRDASHSRRFATCGAHNRAPAFGVRRIPSLWIEGYVKDAPGRTDSGAAASRRHSKSGLRLRGRELQVRETEEGPFGVVGQAFDFPAVGEDDLLYHG